MTLAEFHSKPLTTKTDGVEVVAQVPFDDVCAYIAEGADTKVAHLLAGLWVSYKVFNKEQILQAIICALFPSKGYMRRTTSSSAFMLAKATGCSRELQKTIEERWGSITERNTNEVVLGLSGTGDFVEWEALFPMLFKANENNDIRTQVIRALSNIARLGQSPDAGKLLSELLRQISKEERAYSNPHNYQFIMSLESNRDRHTG